MEDKRIVIEDSSRTARRKQIKNLGTTAVAYLVELITNSDDSYKRLEEAGVVDPSSQKVIYIDLKKKNGEFVFSVTDNAEGMSEDRVLQIFKKYGGDNAGGGNGGGSRGIFGQGATDVMVNASMDDKDAMLESIKDGVMCRFYFNWDDKTGQRVLEQKKLTFNKNQFEGIRKNLRIPENGTRMTFGVPSTVKFKENTIVDDLEGAYALRYILSAPNRKVVLTKAGGASIELSSVKYILDEAKLLDRKSFDFTFEGDTLKCELSLYRNPNKPKEGDYKTHIIVTDSKEVVYANTFFGFEKMPKGKDISGVLKIDGLYDLCKKHLNQANPDEIINDDRTGFNEKHEFYKLIQKKHLDKLIGDCINTHATPVEEVDITKNKKFKNALSAMNKWMSEELKRDIPGGGESGKNPPADGLDFGKVKISITKGVSYDLKLYINPELITTEDDIFVDVDNNEDNISFTPDVISYNENEINKGIVTKSISLTALNVTAEDDYVILTVSSKQYSKSIAIKVLDVDVIYPADGLDFELKEVTLTPNSNHKSVMWFDTDSYELGTKIRFESDDFTLITKEIVLKQDYMVTDNIGKFTVIYTGGVVGNDYTLKAICEKDGLIKEQIVHIRNSEARDPGTKGMFTSIQLWQDEDEDFQILFDEKTGIIYINPFSPINKAMMGDLSNTDPQKPTFNKAQNQYIADLLAYQSALIDVQELERKNQIDINPEARLQAYNQAIGEKKAKVFKQIFKAMEEA